MTDQNGRPFVRSEDRTTRYRLYPVAGEPDVGQVPTVNANLDMEFAAPSGTSSGGVDAAEVSGLRGWLAALAPLLSPRFLGTPTKNGVALATTADIPAGTDPSVTSGLLGLMQSKAPLLSPVLLGAPRVPTATPGTNSTVAASTAYADAAVAAVTYDSEQSILASQIFGA